MIYIFNGIEVDTKTGNEKLGLPPGRIIPMKKGDYLTLRRLGGRAPRWVAPMSGTYEFHGLDLENIKIVGADQGKNAAPSLGQT